MTELLRARLQRGRRAGDRGGAGRGCEHGKEEERGPEPRRDGEHEQAREVGLRDARRLCQEPERGSNGMRGHGQQFWAHPLREPEVRRRHAPCQHHRHDTRYV
jgi:hypothetical protein